MNCEHCRTPADAGAEFCGACGKRLERELRPGRAGKDERGAVALPQPRLAWRAQLFPAEGASTHERRAAWQLRVVAVLLIVILLEVAAGIAQVAPERRAHRAENVVA